MKEYLPITTVIFLWTWPAIFIKMLSSYFDVHTQVFYLYLIGWFTLIVVNLVSQRRRLYSGFKEIRKFILPAALIYVSETLYVAGVYMLTPTVAVLLIKSSLLFIILLSFVFFADERRIIRSKSFVVGSLFVAVGVCGVIVGKGSLHLDGFNLGVVLILLGSVSWGLCCVLIKIRVGRIGAFVSAGVIFTLSLPMFLVSALLFGDVKELYVAPRGTVILLLLYGILCVGVGTGLNYKSIKLIGVVISSSLLLVTPLFTAILSYIIFGETLTTYQILAATILLTGCYMLIRAGSLVNRQSKVQDSLHISPG